MPSSSGLVQGGEAELFAPAHSEPASGPGENEQRRLQKTAVLKPEKIKYSNRYKMRDSGRTETESVRDNRAKHARETHRLNDRETLSRDREMLGIVCPSSGCGSIGNPLRTYCIVQLMAGCDHQQSVWCTLPTPESTVAELSTAECPANKQQLISRVHPMPHISLRMATYPAFNYSCWKEFVSFPVGRTSLDASSMIRYGPT